MKITVVYDNNAMEGLQCGWGFACLIETGTNNILFDTGWDGHLLLENMEKLSIDPGIIDTLILSHQHWDHIGGLTTFLNANPDVDVYVPAGFSPRLKKEITSRISKKLYGINSAQKICDKVYTTGELETPVNGIKEQALVLASDSGNYVLTGCAHPGMLLIIEAASAFGNITGVLGDYMTVRNMGFSGICNS
ncbi:MAG: MBL fold metallo-hydrolase [Methanolobus sp.]